MEKICPIMSRPLCPEDGDSFMEWIKCQEEKCQMWTTVYTTENKTIQGCSLEMKTHMNNGQYEV